MVNKIINMKWVVVLFTTCQTLQISNHVYITSRSPQSDLKIISPQQCNYIAKEWYNKIMIHSDKKSKNSIMKKIEKSPYDHIIQSVNLLESYFQSSKKNLYVYLAWMPIEEISKSSNDVLSIIVLDKIENTLHLKCIIQNPCWYSQNIDSKELKKCLISLQTEDQVLNMAEFLDNPINIRYKLDWLF